MKFLHTLSPANHLFSCAISLIFSPFPFSIKIPLLSSPSRNLSLSLSWYAIASKTLKFDSKTLRKSYRYISELNCYDPIFVRTTDKKKALLFFLNLSFSPIPSNLRHSIVVDQFSSRRIDRFPIAVSIRAMLSISR